MVEAPNMGRPRRGQGIGRLQATDATLPAASTADIGRQLQQREQDEEAMLGEGDEKPGLGQVGERSSHTKPRSERPNAGAGPLLAGGITYLTTSLPSTSFSILRPCYDSSAPLGRNLFQMGRRPFTVMVRRCVSLPPKCMYICGGAA